ncbi:hypothetical protein C9374_000610 [Naegleria lovaniensis]|uniref:Uncharacterized protein n=1 Tax=Naegleria lovaniensis TaxID=51637 RepID=A0AA88GYP9_NAELO|nr:uncharacterized protein C9374_000610 [Naegleria lovaniensis]KAG2388446.1 hypothetical protein C9374_000610 [Naegleria lovaniensis]
METFQISHPQEHSITTCNSIISRWLFFGCSGSNSANHHEVSGNSFNVLEANSNLPSPFQIHHQQPIPSSSFSPAQVFLYVFFVYLSLIVTKCLILIMSSLYNRFYGNIASSSSSSSTTSNLTSSSSDSSSSTNVQNIVSRKLNHLISQTWRLRKLIFAILGIVSTLFIIIYSHHSPMNCFSSERLTCSSILSRETTRKNSTQINLMPNITQPATNTIPSLRNKSFSLQKLTTNHNSCLYSPAKHLVNMWNMAKENAILSRQAQQEQSCLFESLLRSCVNILVLTIKLLYVYLSLIGVVIVVRWLAFGSLSLNSAMHIYGTPAHAVTNTVASTKIKINAFRMP